MGCINLGPIGPPQIPSVLLPTLGPFSISLGSVGVTCCAINLPIFQIPPIFGFGSIVADAIAQINIAIIAAWPLLSLQLPNCSFNGTAPFGSDYPL